MDYTNYQQFIKEYSDSYQLNTRIAIDTQVMGIMGETGELIECLKKETRDGILNLDKLKGEIGDVLAYLSLVAGHFGVSFAIIDDSELIRGFYDGMSNLELCKNLYTAVNCVIYQYTSKDILSVFHALESICIAKGLEMEDIRYSNYCKLLKRWDEGKQRGWGDFR